MFFPKEQLLLYSSYPFPCANVASGEPGLPLGKRNWKSRFWCEVAWFLMLATDWDFLKAWCGPALQDKQNTSVGWIQPAGYWLATYGLNWFQKVPGIPTPSAVARIVAYLCYFSLDIFPLNWFCNSMGELPLRYVATATKETGYKQERDIKWI